MARATHDSSDSAGQSAGTDSAGFPPILDGHNDTLLNLHRPERGQGRDFFARGTVGHIDLPRARAGGLGGGFFAVFVPPVSRSDDDLTITGTGYEVRQAPPLDPEYALRMTMALTASLFRLEARSDGQLKVVRTVEELDRCLRDGVPFRYPASPDTGPGLTDAGHALVRACNRLGILLDLSHLSERGFWDVAELSDAPLVATHSAAHAICASTRNLTDKQLDAIRASGGMVGMNFEVSAVRPDGYDEPDTPLGTLVSQVDYLVDRLGIDGVGFGSDFDGATMPRSIGDVAGLSRLMEALRAHGYDDASLGKLAHQNWLRVLGRTWHSHPR